MDYKEWELLEDECKTCDHPQSQCTCGDDEKSVLRLSGRMIEIEIVEGETEVLEDIPGLTICLHPECENTLPQDGSREPYCSSVCFLHNNLPMSCTLAEAKSKVFMEDL